MRKHTLLKSLALAAGLAVAAFAGTGSALAAAPPGAPPGTGPMIYVTSQDLVYNSVVLGPLPMEGPFQELVPTVDGLVTEFGPGDIGYVGGRWWLDANGDGEMNEGDAFFMCPLLPPGREPG